MAVPFLLIARLLSEDDEEPLKSDALDGASSRPFEFSPSSGGAERCVLEDKNDGTVEVVYVALTLFASLPRALSRLKICTPRSPPFNCPSTATIHISLCPDRIISHSTRVK